MSLFVRLAGSVDDAARHGLLDALMRSAYVGRSQLAGTFRASRGFGLVFGRHHLDEVRERHRALAPFLDLLDEGDPGRHLGGWVSRLRPGPRPNAFYLNLLIVDDGAGVGRHVDGTLQDAVCIPDLTPRWVTVLYLDVPARQRGGELVLYEGRLRACSLEPEAGTLLHFRGDLAHEVSPLEGASGPRVSLVCEQYALDDDALSRLGPLRLQTRAPDMPFAGAVHERDFAALLERKRSRDDR